MRLAFKVDARPLTLVPLVLTRPWLRGLLRILPHRSQKVRRCSQELLSNAEADLSVLRLMLALVSVASSRNHQMRYRRRTALPLAQSSTHDMVTARHEGRGAYQLKNSRRALRSSCALLGAMSAMRAICATL